MSDTPQDWAANYFRLSPGQARVLSEKSNVGKARWIMVHRPSVVRMMLVNAFEAASTKGKETPK